MVSGIRFFACSGAMGGTGNIGGGGTATLYAAGRADPLLEIFGFEISATNSPNRMGFFGTGGAPSSPVIVGQYQDHTFRTDHVGADLGVMINNKFNSSTTATVSGTFGANGVLGSVDISDIPNLSGTLMCRFREPNDTPVITQQAVFRAINLTAASGAPDVSDLATGITVQAAQLADTDGDAGDSTWTEISSGGSSLSLADQTAEATIHDYHLIVAGNPGAAGRKINFAYYIQLEFL
jgi:hypothetical protein